MTARHLTRFPIVRLRQQWFALETSDGRRLSFHRTVSGALRARRVVIEQEHHHDRQDDPRTR